MGTIDILVIDDDPIVNQYLPRSLSDAFSNVSVQAALTNNEAWDKLTTGSYDVILYDLGNDEDEHYPFAEKMREHAPGAVIIAMSLASRLYHRNLPKDVFNDFINSVQFSQSALCNDKYWVLSEACKKYGITLERAITQSNA